MLMSRTTPTPDRSRGSMQYDWKKVPGHRDSTPALGAAANKRAFSPAVKSSSYRSGRDASMKTGFGRLGCSPTAGRSK